MHTSPVTLTEIEISRNKVDKVETISARYSHAFICRFILLRRKYSLTFAVCSRNFAQLCFTM